LLGNVGLKDERKKPEGRLSDEKKLLGRPGAENRGKGGWGI